MNKGDHGGDYHQDGVGPSSPPSADNSRAIAARGKHDSSADNSRAIAARISDVTGQPGIENQNIPSAADHEAVRDDDEVSIFAVAAGTLTEADRGPSEWSEGDERLLKWLVGPRSESIPNTLLGPLERSDIDDRFQKLMERLTKTQETLKLTTEQLRMIQTTLDTTRKESSRIGRKDWLLFGIGTLTTLAISGAFSPAAAVYLAKLFIHEVAHLFGELAG